MDDRPGTAAVIIENIAHLLLLTCFGIFLFHFLIKFGVKIPIDHSIKVWIVPIAFAWSIFGAYGGIVVEIFKEIFKNKKPKKE